MLTYLYIFIGGGLGAISRFGVGRITLKYLGEGFPYGTLFSNILSCIILAVILSVSIGSKWLSDDLKMLLIVGFCGGFSTFSTFSLDTINLIKTGQMFLALFNVLISVFLCIAIIYFLFQKQKAI